MIEIIENGRLIELAIEKHNRFLGEYSAEFSEIEGKLNALKQQSDAIKKEIETAESRIVVLAEKYHLLFYQARKQREEIFNPLLGKLRSCKSSNLQDVMRLDSRIEEFEKRLQNSKSIEDEESIIAEIKKILHEFESAGSKAGLTVTFKGVADKLDEAISSHKELLSLENMPKERIVSAKGHEKQSGEIETRQSWLKHRIDSHKNALIHWEKQKGGIPVG